MTIFEVSNERGEHYMMQDLLTTIFHQLNPPVPLFPTTTKIIVTMFCLWHDEQEKNI
jgi:gluconate kinase